MLNEFLKIEFKVDGNVVEKTVVKSKENIIAISKFLIKNRKKILKTLTNSKYDINKAIRRVVKKIHGDCGIALKIDNIPSVVIHILTNKNEPVGRYVKLSLVNCFTYYENGNFINKEPNYLISIFPTSEELNKNLIKISYNALTPNFDYAFLDFSDLYKIKEYFYKLLLQSKKEKSEILFIIISNKIKKVVSLKKYNKLEEQEINGDFYTKIINLIAEDQEAKTFGKISKKEGN